MSGSGSGSGPGHEGDTAAYTIRLELVDRPGELLRALEPIADRGGNLLSIFHERGNLTPRGRIPVEVDLECTPEQFSAIVTALREADINVIQAGADRYGEALVVLLVGDLVETDLSDTLERIEADAGASVRDLALAAPEGTDADAASSARLRLGVESGRLAETLEAVRGIAGTKGLSVIEPASPDGEA